MLTYTVRITGTKEELARLSRLGSKLVDFSSALKSIGSQLKTFYSKDVFRSEGGATDKKWAQLSPIYKKWKGKHYPNKGILIATGTMQKSFRAVNTRTSLTIDNTDKKFAWHQEGTRRMPARPMLVVNTKVADIIGEEIKADVHKKIAGY